MRGAATQAMPVCIGEERQQSRCRPAAAPLRAAARRPAGGVARPLHTAPAAPGMLVARALPAGLGASSKMYTLFPDGPLVGSPLPTGGTPVPRELCAYQENLDALKDVLQAELQLAHVGARPADPAVVDAAEARVRGGEVRMVREIERLEPELHRVVLPGQVEVLEDREVPLGDSRTDERVAADVAEGAEGLEDVGCRVEPTLGRRVG